MVDGCHHCLAALRGTETLGKNVPNRGPVGFYVCKAICGTAFRKHWGYWETRQRLLNSQIINSIKLLFSKSVVMK